MKKKVISIVALLMIVVYIFATSTIPTIDFTTNKKNMGVVKLGEKASCEFQFKNSGKEPLIILNVTTSCDCTTATAPKEPIMPGQSGTIKVVYDADEIGEINKQIIVRSNAETPTVILKVSGEVI